MFDPSEILVMTLFAFGYSHRCAARHISIEGHRESMLVFGRWKILVKTTVHCSAGGNGRQQIPQQPIVLGNGEGVLQTCAH